MALGIETGFVDVICYRGVGMRFDEGETALAALIEGLGPESDLNEATTRLRLIDRLMFETLGWDQADCEAEERLDHTIADYTFRSPHRSLIVEAKREGVTFELPVGDEKVHRSPIEYFRKHASSVYDAIEQCVHYCQERGCCYGAVSNGRQFVVFLASRLDGIPPLQGEALVVPSLEAMQADFLQVWNCLSKDAVIAQRLSAVLAESATQPPPPKLSASIFGYPGYKNRNTIQTELQILGDLVIEDVTRADESEEEFLRACYSTNGALSQYALVSKSLLEARYSALFEKVVGGPSMTPANTKKGINPDLLAKSLSRRPILLVGDVGAGKTTFIRRLIKIGAKDLLHNAVVLYLDLGTKPTLSRDLPSYLCEEIKHELREQYSIDIEDRQFVRGVYDLELKRFGKSIYGDLQEKDPAGYEDKEREFLSSKLADDDRHLRESLEHLSKARRQQIVIFLDNVDQRPHDFQQEIFLIGTSMASEWPATVFITLRPESYYRSRSSGALTAYHPKAFTISPPRLDTVIQKRLDYAMHVIDGGQLSAIPGVTFESGQLRDYIEVLQQSFNRDRDLIEFCDNMAGGNIRLALDFVKTFIGSGHVDTQKILRIFGESGHYYVPLHEFVRAIVYRDNEYYNPGSSEIMNIFSVMSSDPREHFLVPILLATIERMANDNLNGFVDITTVVDVAQALGFNAAQTRWALTRCLAKRLIQRPARSVDEEGSDTNVETEHVRITTIGAYYIKRLIFNFNYVDAVVVDTPIVDPEVRTKIGPATDIRDRLDRARTFRAYLDSQWSRVSGGKPVLDWPVISAQLGASLASIQSRVEVNDAPQLWP